MIDPGNQEHRAASGGIDAGESVAHERVMVAGAAGMVGSHLVQRLLLDGHEVVGVDNFCTGHHRHLRDVLVHPRFELVEADITGDLSSLGAFDAICNLASPASPVDFDTMPGEILRSGSQGTMNLLELARDTGARFLLASTSEVYGEPEVHPQIEEYRGNVSTTGPRACYDEAKRFAEAATSSFERHWGLEVRIARIFNTYGPHMRPDDGRVVSNFCMQALSGRPLTLHGDGSQTRSFCFVEDLVDGLVALLRSEVQGPVNLGNDEELSVARLAEQVAAIAGVDVLVEHRPMPEDDPTRRRPDLTRAREQLGWAPRTPLVDGLASTMAWFEQLLEPTDAEEDVRPGGWFSRVLAGRAP
jgi:dTDP-glucose 4,6-dehydratase